MHTNVQDECQAAGPHVMRANLETLPTQHRYSILRALPALSAVPTHGCTCRLVEDTAWHPMTEESLKTFSENKVVGALFKIFLGTPLKLWASVGHWALWHFDLKKFTEKQHPRVRTYACHTCAICSTPLSSFAITPRRPMNQCSLFVVILCFWS